MLGLEDISLTCLVTRMAPCDVSMWLCFLIAWWPSGLSATVPGAQGPMCTCSCRGERSGIALHDHPRHSPVLSGPQQSQNQPRFKGQGHRPHFLVGRGAKNFEGTFSPTSGMKE